MLSIEAFGGLGIVTRNGLYLIHENHNESTFNLLFISYFAIKFIHYI